MTPAEELLRKATAIKKEYGRFINNICILQAEPEDGILETVKEAFTSVEGLRPLLHNMGGIGQLTEEYQSAAKIHRELLEKILNYDFTFKLGLQDQVIRSNCILYYTN